MGISVTEAALGIIKVVNNNMALTMRANSVARGYDPREFSLMPFGGAGPFHGVALAELVSAKDVLVPLAPGITAAMGLLCTNLQYEHIRSVITNLYTATQAQMDKVNAVIETLVAAGNVDLDADAIPAPDRRFEVIAEVRYHGQGFELRVPIPGGTLTEANRTEVIAAFHARHTADYGYAFDDALVELYNIRVIATAAAPHLQLPAVPKGTQADVPASLLYTRETVFDDGSTHQTPRYDRTKLGAGVTVDGPAILIQHNSTTLLPPTYRAEVLTYGSLRIAKI
jgi:N-methylhydantoinase A